MLKLCFWWKLKHLRHSNVFSMVVVLFVFLVFLVCFLMCKQKLRVIRRIYGVFGQPYTIFAQKVKVAVIL